MKKILTIFILVVAFVLVWLFLYNPFEHPRPTEIMVRCDQGESLADEIDENPQARVVQVTGECNERKSIVLTSENNNTKIIGTDRSKLTTNNFAIKAQPAIRVSSGTGITLENLTIVGNGVGNGIEVFGTYKNPSDIKLEGVTAEGGGGKTGLCLSPEETRENPEKAATQYDQNTEIDRCVASLNLIQDPVGRAPQYSKEPLLATTYRNAFISNAAASDHIGLPVPVSATICTDDFIGYSFAGIYVGPGARLNVHGTGVCRVKTNNNGRGIMLNSSATMDTENAQIEAKDNTVRGWLFVGGSSGSFRNNTKVNSTGNGSSAGHDIDLRSSTVDCDNTSHIMTTSGRYHCP